MQCGCTWGFFVGSCNYVYIYKLAIKAKSHVLVINNTKLSLTEKLLFFVTLLIVSITIIALTYAIIAYFFNNHYLLYIFASLPLLDLDYYFLEFNESSPGNSQPSSGGQGGNSPTRNNNQQHLLMDTDSVSSSSESEEDEGYKTWDEGATTPPNYNATQDNQPQSYRNMHVRYTSIPNERVNTDWSYRAPNSFQEYTSNPSYNSETGIFNQLGLNSANSEQFDAEVESWKAKVKSEAIESFQADGPALQCIWNRQPSELFPSSTEQPPNASTDCAS